MWHASQSRIDIYSPPSAPDLPIPLRRLPHTLVANISEPQRDHLTSTDPREWDISSLMQTPFHSEYRPLHEIESFIRGLQSTRPDLVNLQELGHSALGREMYGLTISRGRDRKPRKKENSQRLRNHAKLGFVILGAQHAREVRIY